MKQVGYGIIGAGNIAALHAKALSALKNAELVAVYDRNTAAAKRLAERFMPGPVTLVVPDKNGVTFGFRIPDHPFILELLNACGKPLASTSANRSGEPPALEVSYACSSLAEQPDCVVDAGPLPSNSLASTVILVNADGSWKLLREGPVSKAEIEQALR